MHYHYIVLACLLDMALSSPIPTTRGNPIIGAVMPSDLPSGAPIWGMGQGMERPGPSPTENLVVVTIPTTTSAPTTTSTSTSSSTTSSIDPAMVPGARFIGFGNVKTNTTTSTTPTPAAAMGAAQVRTRPARH